MSKYTTEVRYICENYAGLTDSKGYNNVEEIISSARTHVFDFDYPIFDATYKPILERKILKRYYTREIGEETVGLWKLRLNMRLNEIMPYYNKLYESELLEFNPLYDVDLTTTHEKTGEGTEEGTTSNTKVGTGTDARQGTEATTRNETNNGTLGRTTSDTKWDYYNDTPQGGINGIEPEINQLNYLTNVTKDTDAFSQNDTTSNTIAETINKNYTDNLTKNDRETNDGTTTKEINTTEEYTEHVNGKRGGMTYSSMLKEFRETFLNIDKRIIDELADLFLNLW